jgi:hypothetical protein
LAAPLTPVQLELGLQEAVPLQVDVVETHLPPPHWLSLVQRQVLGGLEAFGVPMPFVQLHVPVGSVPAFVTPGQVPLPVVHVNFESVQEYDVEHAVFASFWHIVCRFTPAVDEAEPVQGPCPLHWFWVALFTQ